MLISNADLYVGNAMTGEGGWVVSRMSIQVNKSQKLNCLRGVGGQKRPKLCLRSY